MSNTITAVLKGVLTDTEEHKRQIVDGFEREFGHPVEVVRSFRTAEDRADVIIKVPMGIISRLAVHEWHIGGMLSWADDYADNNNINKAPAEIIDLIRAE